MKKQEEEWEPRPEFDGKEFSDLPVEEPRPFRDEPETFLAMRRIEYLGRMHHMAFRSVLQGAGLPPAQMNALKSILRAPGMSQRELADALHIQRATATVMLQKMEKSGYIDRRPDQDDQRIYRIYPTDTARTLDEESKKAVDNYFAACFLDFTPEELHALDVVLTKLGKNIQAVIELGLDAPDKE
jgi:DNA-binding MarR family transcriptional regulator